MPYLNWVADVGSWRFGLTHDLVKETGEPYLERWIIWCGITLRLHKFHKGDDDRAFHDHPWWFVTLPLRTYFERTPQQEQVVVKRWRPHFRRADHRHIVQMTDGLPVWTFIITGPKSKEWGFWDNNEFVHHQQWLNSREPTL